MRWSDVPAFAAIPVIAVAVLAVVVGAGQWLLVLVPVMFGLLGWSAFWTWQTTRYPIRRAQEARGYFWGDR